MPHQRIFVNHGISAGKEFTCKAGDPSSIPGFGRPPGEGIGYPLQYTWASLVAQMVKNPPAVRESWVRSLGWKDPLEGAWQPTPLFLAWRIPKDRRAWQAVVHGVAKSQTQLSNFHFTHILSSHFSSGWGK